LGGFKEKDMKRLSPVVNLRTLLMKRGAPESLKGLESAQQLEKVIFGNSKKLKDIQAMSEWIKELYYNPRKHYNVSIKTPRPDEVRKNNMDVLRNAAEKLKGKQSTAELHPHSSGGVGEMGRVPGGWEAGYSIGAAAAFAACGSHRCSRCRCSSFPCRSVRSAPDGDARSGGLWPGIPCV
jgi:hypothetical protein